MRAVAIGLVVAACSSTAPPPIAQNTAAEQPEPLAPRPPLVDRQLDVGTLAPGAVRSTWELSIDGSNATLVETEQEAPGVVTLERADGATWTTASTRVQKAPVRTVGDHIALDFATATDSLFLRCWHRSLAVAGAGARRVPTPGVHPDCSDPGAWSPATLTRVDALVCGQGDALDDGQVAGLDGQRGSVDETLWRFAPAPGVELVEESDDCFQSTGLRLAR